MIGIVDYGMGNLYSVRKAIERLGYAYRIVGVTEAFDDLDGLVLPGVGAFGDAMAILKETKLDEAIVRFVQEGKPLLGICLGMQLLFEESEEHGLHKGLGLLPGRVVRFQGDYKVPHMGWNKLNFRNPSTLFQGVAEDYVYFVHSYFVKTNQEDILLATADYHQEVPAIVGKDNIYGMQFHPEKSGDTGMMLLNNFIHMTQKKSFTLFPAIDLRNGKAVRLYQGDYNQETVYGDPIEIASKFQEEGAEWVHIVDLDGAKAGYPAQMELILQLANSLTIPVQVGGGIRSLETLSSYLEGGVQRIILGTAAVEDLDFLKEALNRYGDRIAIGIDARNGKVATRGWLEDSELEAVTLGKELAALGAKRFIYTDIAKDGTLAGPNIAKTVELALQTGQSVIASGGISSLKDLQELQKYRDQGVEGAIIGKAIYTGKIVLGNAIKERTRKEKNDASQTNNPMS